MRYLTKTLYESEFFYQRYIDYGSSFQYYMIQKTRFLNIRKKYTFEEAFEIACEWENLKHKEHVDFFFYENILFYDELKKLMFDENKTLKPFNEELYMILMIYVSKYNSYKLDALDKVYDSAKSIETGNFPKVIKELAKLNKKDMFILSIDFGERYLKMIIDYGDTYKTYFFHTIPYAAAQKEAGTPSKPSPAPVNTKAIIIAEDVTIKRETNKNWEKENLLLEQDRLYAMLPLQIKYEELFLDEDDVFEYNILVLLNSREIRNSTEDLSIKFIELEMID